MLISLLGLSSAMKVGLCSITNRLQAFFKYGSNLKYSSEMAFWRRLLNCITCEKSMNIVLDSLPLIASISASQYGSAALFPTLKLKFHPQIFTKNTQIYIHTHTHKNTQNFSKIENFTIGKAKEETFGGSRGKWFRLERLFHRRSNHQMLPFSSSSSSESDSETLAFSLSHSE